MPTSTRSPPLAAGAVPTGRLEVRELEYDPDAATTAAGGPLTYACGIHNHMTGRVLAR